jgi:hypothetical protein
MMCDVGIARHRAQSYTAVCGAFDVCQVEMVEIDQHVGTLDVETHQVDHRGAAGDEPRARRQYVAYGFEGICRTAQFEQLHVLELAVSARILDGGDNIFVRSTATDVPAHRFGDIGVAGAARFRE